MGGALCLEPVAAGLASGKIVACQRGPGRAAKGCNVLQYGAVGFVEHIEEPPIGARPRRSPVGHLGVTVPALPAEQVGEDLVESPCRHVAGVSPLNTIAERRSRVQTA